MKKKLYPLTLFLGHIHAFYILVTRAEQPQQQSHYQQVPGSHRTQYGVYQPQQPSYQAPKSTTTHQQQQPVQGQDYKGDYKNNQGDYNNNGQSGSQQAPPPPYK